MHAQIASIIRAEVERFTGEESLANAVRCAAWFVMDDFPDAKAVDFGEAASLIGLHQQGAINRWNEAKKNLEMAKIGTHHV